MGFRGMTLLEVIIVLAILGVCAGLAAWQWPSPLGPATAALRNLVLQGRLEAVTLGQSVAVVYDAASREFQIRRGPAETHLVCPAGEVTNRLRLADFRGVAAAGASGLVWLPTGMGRTCTGTGVFNQTFVLQRGDQAGRVLVSRAGRVRSQVDFR